MKVISQVLNYFIPEICPYCQEKFTKDGLFCEECLGKLSTPGQNTCKNCGGDLDLILDICSKCMKEEAVPWSDAICLFIMNHNVQHIVEQYKYNSKIEFLSQLADSAARKIQDSKIHFDCITAVPLHFMKYLYRGYNQSALLAKKIAIVAGIGYKNLLVRRKFTKTQTRLSGEERHKNLKGAFFSKNKAFIEKKDILLIDDVFTTGSTLRAASETLLMAGANSVAILVLARR